MKRFYYHKNDFVDEFSRVWALSYSNGCSKWTLTGEIVTLPKDFKYIEYVPSYAM